MDQESDKHRDYPSVLLAYAPIILKVFIKEEETTSGVKGNECKQREYSITYPPLSRGYLIKEKPGEAPNYGVHARIKYL